MLRTRVAGGLRPSLTPTRPWLLFYGLVRGTNSHIVEAFFPCRFARRLHRLVPLDAAGRGVPTPAAMRAKPTPLRIVVADEPHVVAKTGRMPTDRLNLYKGHGHSKACACPHAQHSITARHVRHSMMSLSQK